MKPTQSSVSWTLGLALAAGLSAPAEAARYLVKLRSPSLMRALAAQVTFGGQPRFKVLANVGFAVAENEDHLNALTATGDVEFVEADGEYRLLNVAPTAPEIGEMTWGVGAVRAPEAWQELLSAGAARPARVAVLDSGLDVSHADIAPAFEKGRSFFGSAPMSLPGLLNETPFVPAPNEVEDGLGHGTHVAGTIAGIQDDKGVVGVAPQARLLAGRVCSADSRCSFAAVVEAVDWAIAEGVDVINMSLGGNSPSRALEEALKRAETAGVVSVAASGNSCTRSGCHAMSYPAAFPSVLSVGAVDSNLQRAFFSQYATGLTVAAPGVGIRSSTPKELGMASRVTVSSPSGDVVIPSLVAMGSTSSVQTARLVLDTTDVAAISGNLVLLERPAGVLDLAERINELSRAGAVGVIVANTKGFDGLTPYYGAEDGFDDSARLPNATITAADGQALRDRLAAHEIVNVTLEVGASHEAVWQGTSMASPHVAGVVALLKAARPKLSTADVRSILQQTARKVPEKITGELGAGLVDAQAALAKALTIAP
jgi:subtilisin family serine protease